MVVPVKNLSRGSNRTIQSFTKDYNYLKPYKCANYSYWIGIFDDKQNY